MGDVIESKGHLILDYYMSQFGDKNLKNEVSVKIKVSSVESAIKHMSGLLKEKYKGIKKDG